MLLLGQGFEADMIFMICASSVENSETAIAYRPLTARARDQSDLVIGLIESLIDYLTSLNLCSFTYQMRIKKSYLYKY